MASGGSYHINEHGQRVLKQRSGHNIQPQPPAAPAKTKKVNTDENEKKSTAGRG